MAICRIRRWLGEVTSGMLFSRAVKPINNTRAGVTPFRNKLLDLPLETNNKYYLSLFA